MQKLLRRLILPVAAMLLAACSHEDGTATSMAHGGHNNPASATHLDVYMTRTCGCCGLWVEHAEQQGFHTVVHYMEQDELTQEKLERGIGFRLQSCHTAVSREGYVFEGHIPGRLIHDFLADVPDNAIGLTVPGMPIGSPGMEMGDRFDPYDVLLVNTDGSTQVFTHVSALDQQY